jgi:peptidoglycan/xylan/chitin deacetylase (PgdA/CDA1 family)
MATLLIGYDVESPGHDQQTTPAFLSKMLEVHRRWSAPASLFLMGITIETNPDAIVEAAASPLISIGQHTYSHQLFRSLYVERGDAVELVRGADLATIDDELSRTNSLIKSTLGIDCIGLTAPWTYYRGLRNRPDVLAVLQENNIRYVRADGRNSSDYQPVPLAAPYWYDRSGFPDILEFRTHGWHDCVLRDELGWSNLEGYVDVVCSYIDEAVALDSIYSLCAHDWSSIREDPELTHVERILEYALKKGMTISDYETEYRALLAAKT